MPEVTGAASSCATRAKAMSLLRFMRYGCYQMRSEDAPPAGLQSIPRIQPCHIRLAIELASGRGKTPPNHAGKLHVSY